MNKKQSIVHDQRVTVAPLFSTLMFAGFNNQSPLLTMLKWNKKHTNQHILLLKRIYYLKVHLLFISNIIIICWIWLSMCDQMMTSEIISRVCQMMYCMEKNEQECNIRFKNSRPSREFLHLAMRDCECFERLQNLWYRWTLSCTNI